MNQTKETILSVSINLMLQKGYHATSVDDVCAAADVKKGSFYHFFSSKQNMALQALKFNDREVSIVCDDIFSSPADTEKKFQKFLSYIYKYQVQKQKKLKVVAGALPLILGAEITDEADIKNEVCKIISFYEAYYQDAIKATDHAPYSEEIARNLNCCLIGMLTHARIMNSLDYLKSIKSINPYSFSRQYGVYA